MLHKCILGYSIICFSGSSFWVESNQLICIVILIAWFLQDVRSFIGGVFQHGVILSGCFILVFIALSNCI